MYSQETMYINPEIFEYLRDSHIKLQMGRYVRGKDALFKSVEHNVVPSAFYAKKESYKKLSISWKRVPFEKLTGQQLSQKFNAL
jgi:hypothetical protein